MRTIKPIYILFIMSFLFFSANLFSGTSADFSNNRLIIKIKSSSPLLVETRNASPKNYHESYEVNNTNDNFPLLNYLMTQYRINTIKAVKPDADLTPLAAGLERIFIIEFKSVFSIQQTRETLSRDPNIEYAELDNVGFGDGQFSCFGPSNETDASAIPNDPSFSQQWGLRNFGQNINGVNGTPGGDINAVNAWDVTTGNPNTIIAILDSGMPLSHPEFSGRVLQGYDYANNDNDPTDDMGHGTNVTSVSAAKGNNNSLVAGVNWNCKIIPVKILDASNSGLYSWWISGITYAVDHGAKVLNMSVGGSGANSGLQDACTYAYSHGSIICACMMNNNNNVVYYPAGYSNVFSIGAINNLMRRAVPFCWGGGSSYGPHIDFTAPGEMIIGLVYNNANATSYWCGTSQATPMVTGTVSLLLGMDSTLTFSQVYDALKLSARDQVGPSNEDTPGFDNYFGWGLIDSRGALNRIIGVKQISTNVPNGFSLHQNYPNPFNPTTKIRFEVPNVSGSNTVTMIIYDNLGKQVEKLFERNLKPGTYEADWDAAKYSTGVYFYKLFAGDYSETRKMILIK